MSQTLSKVVHDPSKALSILTYHISKHFGHHDSQKFMVLTCSRTGSNPGLFQVPGRKSEIKILMYPDFS